MNSMFIDYITNYGYLGLYIIFGMSILGLPVPVEFLLTFVGFLSFTGELHPMLAVIAATTGSMTGITIAYFLGKFFEHKVHSYLRKHAGSARLEKVLNWYQGHGGKLVTIGYFIPGVRHLSGYVAGLSNMSYRKFAISAYFGAALWTSSFIILGRLLGSKWEKILPVIHRYSLLLGVSATVLSLAFYLTYKKREVWSSWLLAKLRSVPGHYLSLGKKRLLVTVGGILFVALFLLLMGLIQDFVANEVGEFDQLVGSWLVNAVPTGIVRLVQLLNRLGSHLFVAGVFCFASLYFWLTTKRWTYIAPLGLAWIGGSLIDYLFSYLFGGENIVGGFLIGALSFYIVIGYLLGRTKRWFVQGFIIGGEIVLLLLLGVSPMYVMMHSASTTVTGMTVSGLWALICVFLYEFTPYRRDFGGID